MKKIAKILVLAIAALMVATGCKKLPEFHDGSSNGETTIIYPELRTEQVTDITEKSAVFTGYVSNNNAVNIEYEFGFCWNTTGNPTPEDFNVYFEAGAGWNGTFDYEETSLTPNTKYYLRTFATYNGETTYGNEVSFVTLNAGGGSGEAPIVTTSAATGITVNSALFTGIITNYDNSLTYSCMFEWGVSENLDNVIVSESINNGRFSVNLTGLTENTTYYFKAIANNSNGTGNGEIMNFTTHSNNGDVPTGAINGLFTINEFGKQVYFSKGNLQYQASMNRWRFAENQYDVIGGNNNGYNYGNVYENGVLCDNSLVSSYYTGWIDMFGWGTSGYNHGAVCYQPWSTNTDNNNYYAYGKYNYNLYDKTGQADWGYNAIINGGNTLHTWRTLTMDEWYFILQARNTLSGNLFAFAQVNEINGLLIFPDNWNNDIFEINDINVINAPFITNTLTFSDLTLLENNGVVFLPTAGYRAGTSMQNGDEACYWTSSYASGDGVYILLFRSSDVSFHVYGQRNSGRTVRLVHDAE